MSDTTSSRGVIVKHPDGMHVRFATSLTQLVSEFESAITVIKGAERADAASVMHVLGLGAVQGTELEIEANGPDAEAALNALVEFFNQDPIDEEETNQQEANGDVA